MAGPAELVVECDGQRVRQALENLLTNALLPRLFTRFSSGRATKGLGLGLYLARGIAEAHGGTLTVESVPGQGATFRLALPLRQEL